MSFLFLLFSLFCHLVCSVVAFPSCFVIYLVEQSYIFLSKIYHQSLRMILRYLWIIISYPFYWMMELSKRLWILNQQIPISNLKTCIIFCLFSHHSWTTLVYDSFFLDQFLLFFFFDICDVASSIIILYTVLLYSLYCVYLTGLLKIEKLTLLHLGLPLRWRV